MKQTKCTLTEMSSEEAVRVINQENQTIFKGGDWGNTGGCCQYPPTGSSGGSWNNLWNWLLGLFGNYNGNNNH
ncbi:MAG: hypothetical protein R3E32_09370 [Chitinophagales bacterium]